MNTRGRLLRWSLICGLVVPGVAVVAVPASAIAPPQPATCAFGLGPVTANGAAGTAYYAVALVPADPYQQCSTVATVSAAVTTPTGADPAGLSPNSATDVETVQFYASRPDPLVTFGLAPFDGCTTTPQQIELVIRSGTESEIGLRAVSESCSSVGVPSSGIFAATDIGSAQQYADGLAATPGVAGYRVTDNVGFVNTEGAPKMVLIEPDSVAPIVGIAAAPVGDGDWLVASNGGVFSYGSAPFHGSAGDIALNAPIVGMAVDPNTGGYWLVAADGGVFSYDAPFFGSAGNIHLNSPIVGMAVAPGGRGYWLVGADGGVFSYGDAPFDGSAGDLALNAPIVGMAADAHGGYWLAAADGGVFSFGAPFHGSAGGLRLNDPISAITSTPDGGGYWLVGADGGVFTYGDAPFFGAATDQ